MTLAGLTPAQQVAALGLAVGDTIEDRHDYPHGGWIKTRYTLIYAMGDALIWKSYWSDNQEPDYWRENGVYEGGLGAKGARWRKISSDPSIDPTEPLRRELMEAHAVMDRLYNLTCHVLPKSERYPVRDWLARNAAFGAGEVGGE